MAIGFVQSASSLGTGNIVQAFAGNNVAGNCIVVAGAALAGSLTPTLSDTQGNSYSTVLPFTNAVGSITAEVFFAFNVKAGANTVTFIPGSVVASSVAILEFSGVSAIDARSVGTGAGAAQSSGSATSNFANELLFGFTAGVASSGISITQGTGYTLAESHIDSSNTIMSFLTEWQIVSSVGSYLADSSVTVGKGGGFNWGTEMDSLYTLLSGSTFVTGFGF